MTEIYAHEYTITPMFPKSKMGLRGITVTIVTEQQESNSLEIEPLVRELFEQDITVAHKLILAGYRSE